MASNNDFNSLLQQLQELEESKVYLNFGSKIDRRFDSKINEIIKNWISNDTLSNEEKKFIDLYSNLQLCFVEYCIFSSDTAETVQTMIDKFPVLLFKKPQTDTLTAAVEFIHTQPSNDDNSANEDDLILVYIMRMIDARSLAYRLCFKNLYPPPDNLNDELKECLIHREAKNYLYDIKSTNSTNQNLSINSRHKFFIGCCTFAVALFDKNKGFLKNNDHGNKYIYLLVKYIRTMLNKNKFEQDKSIIYCIRGILALLTNCVPTENWIHIINTALANKDDDNAQQANPFNIELFTLIITRLLGSNYIRDKAIKSSSSEATSLVDVALIFLYKWFDTPTDLNDDEDNNENLSTDERNEVLRLLRSNSESGEKLGAAQIIIPYIDAKYDRLRLMAVSTLSYIMNYEDFNDLQKKKPNMAQEIVKLIFDFIDQAVNQVGRIYKGISFDRLLHFLLRFLDQDVFKEQMVSYISKILSYANERNFYALKILRKISSSPKMKQHLIDNVQLNAFLKNGAGEVFGSDSKMKSIINLICRNLAPEPKIEQQIPHNADSRRAFISYSHDDKNECELLEQLLQKFNLFTNIWIDRNEMKDNMVDTITQGIRESDIVFVLLSDSYCKSDYCRREWTFAMQIKKTIYPVSGQEHFKRNAYDWVIFNIGEDYFYKLYKKDESQRLIKTLQKELRKNTDQQLQPTITKATNNLSESQTSLSLTTESNQSNKNENLRKTSIAEWTSEDIQDWCNGNNLEKWCEPLAKYDGQALLDLHKVLATDTNLENITHGHKLTLIDAVLFKSKLNKLLSKPTTTHIPPRRKIGVKRRTSKSSVK